tara:strand:- start:551 stop:1684 length:1134 start_codon:yes stop_codon:yes gene_type:complete
MTIVEKNRHLFAPPFCKTVETYILPIPKSKFEAPNGLGIGDGWRYFDQIRVIQKKIDRYVEVLMSPSELLSSSKVYCKSSFKNAEMHFENIVRKRPAYSKCDMSHPHLMGVINLTPDSFYNNSKKQDYSSVLKTLKQMENYGASIIDLGGESTRPGSKKISTNEEQHRLIHIIKNLKQHDLKSLISLDTRNFSTMKLGYENGVDILNDISGFDNQNKINFVSKNKIPIVVMHMQKEPKTMQNDPKYSFAPTDIYNFFKEKINKLVSMGVDLGNIVIDPGIGFGKNKFHNLDILRNLSIFHSLGVPILIGLSRKSLIEELIIDNFKYRRINKNTVRPSKRLSGSIAFAMHAINHGVQIIRTHDVFDTNQALICQRAVI